MSLSNKTVLIAGAGLVSQPVGDVLAAEGVNIIYGCRNIATAQKTVAAVNAAVAKATDGAVKDKVKAITLDVHNKEQLSSAVASADLVVSLVPPPDHPLVIEAAIQHKKNVLTTSYISPEAQALEPRVKEAGIVVLNELGLDPGFDHLWAVKCLTDIVQSGSKCTSFESYCGGLPAPECSDNALGYRFSWAPAGVLRALNRVAKYKENGADVEKSGVALMESTKRFVTPYKGYALECYANGDSLPYSHEYPGLAEASTIVRGTLRYTGYADICKCLIQIGFIDQTPRDFLKTPISWAEATSKIIGSNGASEEAAVQAILSKHKFKTSEEQEEVIRRLRQMGIFSKDNSIVPQADPSPFYTLCKLLEQQGQYEAGQRDLVLLQHTFHVTKPSGGKSIITATRIEYGDPQGYSAMAKLVGIPAATGCLAILRGEITEPGLLKPTNEQLARPLRETLIMEYGITMDEVEVAL